MKPKRIGLSVVLGAVLGCSGGGGIPGNTVGTGSQFTLVKVEYGRFVDLFDSAGQPSGVGVINPTVVSDPVKFKVSKNPITGHDELKVLQHALGSSGFDQALAEASANLPITANKGPTDTLGFSLVPRNATVVLSFSKKVNPATVDRNTIKFFVGDPPVLPFTVGILAVDPKDASRVFANPAIFDPESVALGLTNNPTGFPPSANNTNATLKIDLPIAIKADIGQNQILLDEEGKALAPFDNQQDPATKDLVRLFRTGGSFDPNGGFLPDADPPKILGAQPITISSAAPSQGKVKVDFTFDIAACGTLPLQAGDALVQGQNFGIVFQSLGGPTPSVLVDVLAGSFAAGPAAYKTVFNEIAHASLLPCFVTVAPTPTVGSTFTGVNKDATFQVEFSEPINTATILPFRTYAITNQDNGSFTDISLAATAGGPRWNNFVVGDINRTADQKSFQFVPILSLNTSKVYNLHVVKGKNGVKDLAGNPLNLTADFVITNMTMTPAGTTTEARVFRFLAANLNEDADPQNTPESNAAGQGLGQGSFLVDPVDQTPIGITGRSATPYRRVVDDTQTFVKLMNVTQGGLQTPLVPLGARMMTLYRYHDIFGGQIPTGETGPTGPSIIDKDAWHVAVKGWNWSPFGGNVFPDSFGRFRGLLGHSLYAPIAQIDNLNTTGPWQNTGFNSASGKNTFDQQTFELANFTGGTGINTGMIGMGLANLKTVFDGAYQLLPSNSFKLGLHTFMPYPDFTTSFTYRDLTLVEPATLGTGAANNNVGLPYVGGGSSSGEFADSTEFNKAQLTPNQVYRLYTGTPSRSLPSIALPLLTEFRCYNFLETGVLPQGTNGFATSFMFNTNQTGNPNPPATMDIKPASRCFSQGYKDLNTGLFTFIYPDTETVPRGGYCPINCPPTGTSPPTKTAARDPTLYWGVGEFQAVESVFFSRWIETTPIASPVYGGVIVEPDSSDLPSGTSLVVEFRGATNVPSNSDALANASKLDPYGNCDGDGILPTGPAGTPFYACSNPPVHPPTESITAWTQDIVSLAGKRFVQMRVRIVANATTNLVPVLKGIGFTFK